MQIVKVSPKGQVTIPQKMRKLCKSGSYALDVIGHTIVLRPVEFKVKDDLKNFEALSEKAFSFWDNDEDDVYQEFYKKHK